MRFSCRVAHRLYCFETKFYTLVYKGILKVMALNEKGMVKWRKKADFLSFRRNISETVGDISYKYEIAYGFSINTNFADLE